MSNYKSPLPSVDCPQKEWSQFCRDHGANLFLIFSDDDNRNKKKQALIKKFPELWELSKQRDGNDDYVDAYIKQTLNRSIQMTIAAMLIAVLGLFVISAILGLIGK